MDALPSAPAVIADFGFGELSDEDAGRWLGALKDYEQERIQEIGFDLHGKKRWNAAQIGSAKLFDECWPPVKAKFVAELHGKTKHVLLKHMAECVARHPEKAWYYWNYCKDHGILDSVQRRLDRLCDFRECDEEFDISSFTCDSRRRVLHSGRWRPPWTAAAIPPP